MIGTNKRFVVFLVVFVSVSYFGYYAKVNHRCGDQSLDMNWSPIYGCELDICDVIAMNHLVTMSRCSVDNFQDGLALVRRLRMDLRKCDWVVDGFAKFSGKDRRDKRFCRMRSAIRNGFGALYHYQTDDANDNYLYVRGFPSLETPGSFCSDELTITKGMNVGEATEFGWVNYGYVVYLEELLDFMERMK